MKYSESSNYRKYIEAYADGDLTRARASLQACLVEAQQTGSAAQQSDLLQRIGEIEHELGHSAVALKLFSDSELADRGSLLAKYQFARFLAEKVGDREAALRKCDEILELVTAHPFAASEDDYGSEEYGQMARALRDTLQPHP